MTIFLIIFGSISVYLMITGIFYALIKEDYINNNERSHRYGEVSDNCALEAAFWPFAIPVRIGHALATGAASAFSLELLNKLLTKTKQKMKTILILFSVVALGAFTYWASGSYITYNNEYNNLTAQYEAEGKVTQLIFDELWKTIAQEANVSEAYSAEFKEVFIQSVEARYRGGAGQVMLWVTEHNPNLTPELYARLMTTIETKRAGFTRSQEALINTHKRLKQLTTTIPSSWFLWGKNIADPRLVTSSRTEGAFDTGQDNDTTVFPPNSSR